MDRDEKENIDVTPFRFALLISLWLVIWLLDVRSDLILPIVSCSKMNLDYIYFKASWIERRKNIYDVTLCFFLFLMGFLLTLV